MRRIKLFYSSSVSRNRNHLVNFLSIIDFLIIKNIFRKVFSKYVYSNVLYYLLEFPAKCMLIRFMKQKYFQRTTNWQKFRHTRLAEYSNNGSSEVGLSLKPLNSISIVLSDKECPENVTSFYFTFRPPRFHGKANVIRVTRETN